MVKDGKLDQEWVKPSKINEIYCSGMVSAIYSSVRLVRLVHFLFEAIKAVNYENYSVGPGATNGD